ncbi:MAG: phosphatase PAP2 family protein [Sphingomonadales bacterium]|nr:phosphatase PAP2 family protein [Sphingomonadales bacterium]
MTSLLEADRTLFFIINQFLCGPWADRFWIPLRNPWTWIPLYVMLSSWIYRFMGKRGLFALLITCLVVAVADQLSSHLIKPWIERPRPCQELVGHVRLLIPCGSGFSFTSSHAANHFAYALFTGKLLRIHWPLLSRLLWIWAALICYAQVYVGVHYPLDVIAGAVLGSVIARSAHNLLARYLTPVEL